MQTSQLSIVIIEDDKLFGDTVTDILEEAGYRVTTLLEPQTLLEEEFKANLYLIDINLPFKDGISLLKELRARGDNTPTIFLTSREDKESIIEGFDNGADDYIKKPVDIDELLARVKAVLRRSIHNSDIVIGAYRLDKESKELYKDDKPLFLGRKIYDLLELLIQNSGKTVTLDEIKQKLWHNEETASDGAIRVYITRIKKLFPNSIQNIRGIGYKFEYSEEQ